MKCSMVIVLLFISIHGNLSELEEFRKSNVLFTSDLYKELLQVNSGNFIACPFSVETVLALVHAGAEGNTAKELADGLHFPDDSPKIQEFFKLLQLNAQKSYTLNSVNKLYIANRFSVNEDYKTIAKNVFKADIEKLDFSENTKAAAVMNNWVEKQTENKIKDLIMAYYLTVNTVSVLINAIYFNANWEYPFNTDLTKSRSFRLNPQRKVDVDMMHTIMDAYLYNHDELRAQFLELPYQSDDVTMTFVLPYDVEGLPALEKNIKSVLQRPNYQDPGQVTIFIPKFKMETQISLVPIMKNLGIKDAFSENANFNRMTVDNHKIHLTQVEQKAFIEVTERGTTAGAATFAISEDRSFGSTFKADHPFIFYLRHKVDGILFIGRFVNPAGTK